MYSFMKKWACRIMEREESIHVSNKIDRKKSKYMYVRLENNNDVNKQ